LLWLAKAFSLPFAVANALRIIWFEAIYAIGVALVVPLLVGLL